MKIIFLALLLFLTTCPFELHATDQDAMESGASSPDHDSADEMDEREIILGEPRHPLMDARFLLGAGVYWSDRSIVLTADGSIPSQQIDFSQSLGLGDSEELGAFVGRWNFGKKWHFTFEYFSSDSTGSVVLEEDIEWEDLVFEAGSFVSAGASLDVTRLVLGRKFYDQGRHQFSAGLGVHWLDIGAFIEGEVKTNAGDNDTEFRRGDVDVAGPLPNVGVEYLYSISPRWAFFSHVDWLSISLDKYRGRFWNITAGLNFAITRHVSLEADYFYFDLDVSVRDDDWRGKADMVFDGPRVMLKAHW